MSNIQFDDYQKRAWALAIYPRLFGGAFVYPVLGLCGEAGEVAEKFKKVIRDSGGIITEDTKELIVKELGDVLWYLAAICSELNIKLSDVADINLVKLTVRAEKGALRGSGDDR